jgi:hypothetical protein
LESTDELFQHQNRNIVKRLQQMQTMIIMTDSESDEDPQQEERKLESEPPKVPIIVN